MKQKKSILISWACSYIAILLIPVVTIYINYYYNARTIKSEIIQANELTLNSLSESIDQLLYDEMAMYAYILADAKFGSLVSNQELNARFYYDAAQMSSQLRAYVGDHINMAGLMYFPGIDYMVADRAGDFSSIRYEVLRLKMSEMPDYESWKEMLSTEYDSEVLFSKYLHFDGSEDYMIYADSVFYNGHEMVNIFVNVPISEIEKLMSPLGNGTCLVLAIDEKILLVMSNEGRLEITDHIQQALAGEEDVRNGWAVIKKESSLRNFSRKKIEYCMLIPEENFWVDYRNARNVFIFGLAGTLLVGFVCAFVLLKRNFQPVHELVNKTAGESGAGNEFQKIEKAFHNLRDENRTMHNRVLTQKKVIQKNVLLSMLKGKYEESRDEELTMELREAEGIVLVGFEIPFSDTEQILHDDLLHFAVDNIYSELMEEEKVFKTEDGRYLFYVFIVEAKEWELWKANCIEKIIYVCELIEDKWGATLTAAVSTMEKPDYLRFQYQDVMGVLEYKKILGGSGVMDTESLNAADNKMSVQRWIVRALEKGDSAKMMETVSNLYEKSGQLPLVIFRMQLMQVFQAVMQLFKDLDMTEERETQLAGYLTPLLVSLDKKEMRKIFEELLLFAYNSIYAQHKGEKGIVAEIKEYVEARYTDSTLNINSIADGIRRNPKYISEVFKKETQEGIWDYINRLRIKKAQFLLRIGKYSVEEVSEKVGYASSKTFTRAFVKVVGVTPGKYREE